MIVVRPVGDNYMDGEEAPPVHLSAFLHMIGIGEDPANAKKSPPKKAGAAPGAPVLAPAHIKYKEKRVALSRQRAQPVQEGDVVFAGAAVISGQPIHLLVTVGSQRDLQAQLADNRRLDSEVKNDWMNHQEEVLEELQRMQGPAVRDYLTKARERLLCRDCTTVICVRAWAPGAPCNGTTLVAGTSGSLGSLVPPRQLRLPGGVVSLVRPADMSVVVGVNPCASIPSNPPTVEDVGACFRMQVLPLLEIVVSGADPALAMPAHCRADHSRLDVTSCMVNAAAIAMPGGPPAPLPWVVTATLSDASGSSPSTHDGGVLTEHGNGGANAAAAPSESTHADNEVTDGQPQQPLRHLVVVDRAYVKYFKVKENAVKRAAEVAAAEEARLREMKRFDTMPHWQIQAGIHPATHGHHDPDPESVRDSDSDVNSDTDTDTDSETGRKRSRGKRQGRSNASTPLLGTALKSFADAKGRQRAASFSSGSHTDDTDIDDATTDSDDTEQDVREYRDSNATGTAPRSSAGALGRKSVGTSSKPGRGSVPKRASKPAAAASKKSAANLKASGKGGSMYGKAAPAADGE